MDGESNKEENMVASRYDARVAIAKKWGNRRKLQEIEKSSQTFATDSQRNHFPHRSTAPADEGALVFPPLCALLRRSWNQTMNGSSLQNRAPATEDYRQQSNSRASSPRQEKRGTFPSVLSVLKANTLKLQMESMEDDIEALSVLPANYDFTTSAVNHMSESRSRAFLLLDFSAIVQTHTEWRKRLPKKGVQMVYSARHNCNVRLLKLLHRLGVGLRVATKYDLAAVGEACDGGTGAGIIWDDTSTIVKPNSFYRNLVLDTKDESTETIPIAVDSTEEMKRIHDQLSRICKRRKQRMPTARFLLKLNDIEIEDWKIELKRMHERSLELSHELVGVALELGTTNCTNGTEKDGDDFILVDTLSDLVENWVGLPHKTKPQVHLTNLITSTQIDRSVVKWIENHHKSCNGVTIDVSRLLMANAAALCTRIIGVKNNDGDNQHLYIDDGCYGSLSNYPNEGIPIPLKSQRLVKFEGSETSELSLEKESNVLVSTNVWGPTCESLKRIVQHFVQKKHRVSVL